MSTLTISQEVVVMAVRRDPESVCHCLWGCGNRRFNLARPAGHLRGVGAGAAVMLKNSAVTAAQVPRSQRRLRRFDGGCK